MRYLLRDSTGWKRALAIFAAILAISAGLCGLNYGAFYLLHPPLSGPSTAGKQAVDRMGGILMTTGMLELLGMAAGALGLVISLLGLLIQAAMNRANTHNE